MGVYIPNVEMPKTCEECAFDINGCELYKQTNAHEYRHSNCPLIEIVRCGECKYIYTDEGVTLCGVWGKYTFKDGFCYQGERRADGDI